MEWPRAQESAFRLGVVKGSGLGAQLAHLSDAQLAKGLELKLDDLKEHCLELQKERGKGGGAVVSVSPMGVVWATWLEVASVLNLVEEWGGSGLM